MDALQKIIAMDDIRTLMARRVRCLDSKDWAGFAACYTSDAISHSFVSDDQPDAQVVGAQAIAERVKTALDGVTTVHQVHAPEIEIHSDDSATGVWPLHDVLSREHEGRRHWMRGYGHYRQSYRRVDDQWLIAEHWLTRLLIERGEDDQVG